jgi:hypothetical protein
LLQVALGDWDTKTNPDCAAGATDVSMCLPPAQTFDVEASYSYKYYHLSLDVVSLDGLLIDGVVLDGKFLKFMSLGPGCYSISQDCIPWMVHMSLDSMDGKSLYGMFVDVIYLDGVLG